MAPSDQLKALVDQMPDPDGRGMYCTDIDAAKIEKAVAAMHRGGREAIVGLIDMLVEPLQGDDVRPVKAKYALHCLALAVCNLADDKPRSEFSLTLASQLGGDRPKAVQAYLVQELQTAGGREVAETLGTLLADDVLCEPAAQALAAIGDGAAEQLRGALGKAAGKRRLTIIQNLGVLRDATSVAALREAVGDPDAGIRLAAGWALANIGDQGAVDLLLRAAKTAKGWERIQMTKACLLLAEKLQTPGKQSATAKASSEEAGNEGAGQVFNDANGVAARRRVGK